MFDAIVYAITFVAGAAMVFHAYAVGVVIARAIQDSAHTNGRTASPKQAGGIQGQAAHQGPEGFAPLTVGGGASGGTDTAEATTARAQADLGLRAPSGPQEGA